jgi:hypothetical protein
MTRQTDGILISEGQNRVFLHPPELYPGSGSGFHHLVELVGGPFQGIIDAVSYERPTGLRPFHRQLVALYQSLAGEAQLPHSYENLKLSLRGDGRGHIAVRAEAVMYSRHVDARCEFSFVIDQTQLPPVIAAVERLFLSASE